MIYLVKMFIIFSECSAESMQGYDTSLIYLKNVGKKVTRKKVTEKKSRIKSHRK